MRLQFQITAIILITFVACTKTGLQQRNTVFGEVESYITSFDQTYKLTPIEPVISDARTSGVEIEINSKERYQAMDGFGYSLTGGSAQHLLSLSSSDRQSILQELFGSAQNSLGISYLRISLGSSDLDEKTFSYNDLSYGAEDPGLANFSLKEDENDLIPILQEILKINPEISIMASPWSPPAWMKTNQSTIGGSLKPECFDVYAQYFVKYIRGMESHGINIDAITVQNEPLHPGNNPSLYMTPEDQAKFIKINLGPAFAKEGIQTKIIIYDHNADRVDYPMTVLNDKEANKYIDGTAFHLYGGKIENLSALHEAFPEKNLYFTEQWIGAPGNFASDISWHMKHLIIGAPRNWCKTVLEWNLSSAPDLQPHTNGGCTKCLGAITIDNGQVIRNPAYYIIGHAAKFVKPGSVRIFSSANSEVPNVAYITPKNDIVLILLNEDQMAKTINITLDGYSADYLVEPESAVTYIFNQ